jgi:hypothetical protein
LELFATTKCPTIVVILALKIAVFFVPTIAQLAAKNFVAMPAALLAPSLASLIPVTFEPPPLMIPQIHLPRWKNFIIFCFSSIPA